MTQPTDRLGQPLSVGDWVIINDGRYENYKINGSRQEIKQIGPFLGWFVSYFTIGDRAVRVGCQFLTKINPKQETTTWDKCAWVPEGVNHGC